MKRIQGFQKFKIIRILAIENLNSEAFGLKGGRQNCSFSIKHGGSVFKRKPNVWLSEVWLRFEGILSSRGKTENSVM